MARRAALIILPTALAYAAYRINELNTRYPLSTARDYNRLSSFIPSEEHEYGDVDYMFTKIPTRQVIQHPLDTYLSAFYSAWTLKIEGLMTRLTGCAPSIPSEGLAFVSGLFPVRSRTTDSIILEWAVPQRILGHFRKRKSVVLGGGLQELSAVQQGNELEIGYACAQWKEGDRELSKVQLELHRFYMRYLLDATRNRLEKELI